MTCKYCHRATKSLQTQAFDSARKNRFQSMPPDSSSDERRRRTTLAASNDKRSVSCGYYKIQSQALDQVRQDRFILTRPDEDRRRRTIIVEKKNGSFGFTLQTYGIHHKREGEVELLTYVDHVEYDGPAFRGGMRPGDVILSINGRNVEKADHRTLVRYIQSCEKTMRLVVLFEDCVKKVDLHIKFLKLKKTLQQKLTEYELLCEREKQLILKAKINGNFKSGTNHDKVNCERSSTPLSLVTSVSSVADSCKSSNVDGGSITSREGREGHERPLEHCKSFEASLDDVFNCNHINIITVSAKSEPDLLEEKEKGNLCCLNNARVNPSSKEKSSKSLPSIADSNAEALPTIISSEKKGSLVNDADFVTRL